MSIILFKHKFTFYLLTVTKLKHIFLTALATTLILYSVYAARIFIACISRLNTGFSYCVFGISSPAIILPVCFIFSLLCFIFSIILFIKVYKSKKIANRTLFMLLPIYCTLFLIPCIHACFMIPQSGGIGLINRILSPIMGPWSRFLRPNAMTLERCTLEYLIFSYSLSALMLISIPFSFWIKNKTFRYISIAIGLASTFIWTGYGIYRIFIDMM